jgi:hypothetical protein
LADITITSNKSLQHSTATKKSPGMDNNARLIDNSYHFSGIIFILFIVDNDSVLVPFPYPSDPMIAERFYEEFSSNNKNKPSETDTGKAKADEKVTKNNSLNFSKYFLQHF